LPLKYKHISVICQSKYQYECKYTFKLKEMGVVTLYFNEHSYINMRAIYQGTCFVTSHLIGRRDKNCNQSTPCILSHISELKDS